MQKQTYQRAGLLSICMFNKEEKKVEPVAQKTPILYSEGVLFARNTRSSYAGSTKKTKYGHRAKDIAQDFAEHLKYSQDADIYHTTKEGRYTALALSVRDRIIHQWNQSRKTQRANGAKKRVYYLSLEFLMGRAMTNNIINLGIEDEVMKALSSLGYTYEELSEVEPDAGLGNGGGLGRLAACFLDSLATLEIPAYGYGIRYNYGIFRQQIKNGWQAEQPDNWLRDGNPWEIHRPDVVYPVQFGGEVQVIREHGRDRFKWSGSEVVNGIAYDTPIIGYGCKTVNTLRLWSAKKARKNSISMNSMMAIIPRLFAPKSVQKT